jgi:hypothetical protein
MNLDMGILSHVATLWHDPQEGVTFSGIMTLPQDLPAGVGLKVVAVPKPLRGRKEKWELHVAIPLPPPPPEHPGPDDIIFKGEIMNQYFRPPRPPGKRTKILIWGDSGTAKTKSALGFPKCAYIDNHGSAEPYESAYEGRHVFAHPTNPDETMGAVQALIKDPGDRLTVVLDDSTTYWDQVQIKWADLFLKRLPQTKGHHAEFYTFQPGDWVHPKREQKTIITRLIALDLNVVIIARAKKEYAGSGSDFMKVIGEVFAGERGLVYEFDYIIRLSYEDGKRWATVNKQRVPAGGKPIPERFEFAIDEQGNSTFFQVLQQYIAPQHFSTPSHAVQDPVKEVIPQADSYTPPTMPPASVPESTSQAPEPPPPITADQLEKLKEFKAHYRISNEEWSKTLLKFYNVNTARAMTSAQADHYTNYLSTQRTPF